MSCESGSKKWKLAANGDVMQRPSKRHAPYFDEPHLKHSLQKLATWLQR